jgi:hypothetical protein
LEVSDVGKTSCTLMWKPPLDDGGNRVTHYIIEKKNCSKPNQNWIPYTNHCKVKRLVFYFSSEFNKGIIDFLFEFRKLSLTFKVLMKIVIMNSEF